MKSFSFIACLTGMLTLSGCDEKYQTIPEQYISNVVQMPQAAMQASVNKDKNLLEKTGVAVISSTMAITLLPIYYLIFWDKNTPIDPDNNKCLTPLSIQKASGTYYHNQGQCFDENVDMTNITLNQWATISQHSKNSAIFSSMNISHNENRCDMIAGTAEMSGKTVALSIFHDSSSFEPKLNPPLKRKPYIYTVLSLSAIHNLI